MGVAGSICRGFFNQRHIHIFAMMLICLLVALVASAQGLAPPPPNDLTIDDIKALTEALELALQSVGGTVSDVTTLCAVGEDELNEIYDFNVMRLDNKNKQHYDLIASYSAQVKTLQHRVDAAKSLDTESQSLADSTSAQVTEQINNFLNGPQIAGKNDAQDVVIGDLADNIATSKANYLSSVANTISSLNNAEDQARAGVNALSDLVASRKCEYGSAAVLPNQSTRVTFKTNFANAPDVTVSMSGFQAHLDVYRMPLTDYDDLNLSKSAENVDANGFDISVVDGSNGMIEAKYVYCSWMACELPTM